MLHMESLPENYTYYTWKVYWRTTHITHRKSTGELHISHMESLPENDTYHTWKVYRRTNGEVYRRTNSELLLELLTLKLATLPRLLSG